MKKIIYRWHWLIVEAGLVLCLFLTGFTTLAAVTFTNPSPAYAYDDYYSDDYSDSEDEGGGAWILLLAGPAFYGIMTLKYRNSDKRHVYERETETTITNIKKSDTLIESRKKTTDSRLPGHNADELAGSAIAGSLKK
ncbi:hypothetical protein FWH30_00870 [Microgenomates group bacterium]|nr:hypothetical protein [Microgenomates group bacterium]